MQNNVTDLSQKLQRSLDNNYNVIDMPAVIEIISTLEKTAVTKELLETTRLGKYINELRRRTTNDSLAKRAKDLVKKWRVLILPDANGQLKAAAPLPVPVLPAPIELPDSPDVPLKSRKRPARDRIEPNAKRPMVNGQARDMEFSDSSNCSVTLRKTDVIFINSDSNSSAPDTFPTHTEPLESEELEPPSQPKKRGRKKGSKNHKNLVAAAEESFSNKMAVSRNSKVKTTQELLADLQNRTTTPAKAVAPVGVVPDVIEQRAARLTESLSRIDQKLNPQRKAHQRNDRVARTPKLLQVVKKEETVEDDDGDVVLVQSDDEIVDVVGEVKKEPEPVAPEITVETLLAQLPPLRTEDAERPDEDEIPECICHIAQPIPPDPITVEIVDGGGKVMNSIFSVPEPEPMPEPAPVAPTHLDGETLEDPECPARLHLRKIYRLQEEVPEDLVKRLHSQYLPTINGNSVENESKSESEAAERPVPHDIVPKLDSERLSKDLCLESYNKYSVSIGRGGGAGGDGAAEPGTCDSEVRTQRAAPVNFREWHEMLDVRSYNGDTLRILPYVIID